MQAQATHPRCLVPMSRRRPAAAQGTPAEPTRNCIEDVLRRAVERDLRLRRAAADEVHDGLEKLHQLLGLADATANDDAVPPSGPQLAGGAANPGSGSQMAIASAGTAAPADNPKTR